MASRHDGASLRTVFMTCQDGMSREEHARMGDVNGLLHIALLLCNVADSPALLRYRT
jgi:hypothetical protein